MLITTAAHGNLDVANASNMPGSGWLLIDSSGNASTSSVTISSTAYTRYEWYYASNATTLSECTASTITSGMAIFATRTNLKLKTTLTSFSAFNIYLYIDAVQKTGVTATPTAFRDIIASRTAL